MRHRGHLTPRGHHSTYHFHHSAPHSYPSAYRPTLMTTLSLSFNRTIIIISHRHSHSSGHIFYICCSVAFHFYTWRDTTLVDNLLLTSFYYILVLWRNQTEANEMQISKRYYKYSLESERCNAYLSKHWTRMTIRPARSLCFTR